MTSNGQRFRRRAIRRGYKVDEVDAFLARVEATLAGEPMEAPVTAQEVHDVVFRVRFGGYDEWQVDLHLDRVERQLAEMGERAPAFGRVPDPRAPGHPAPSPMPHRPSPVPGGAMASGAPPPGPLGQPGPPGPRYDEPTLAGRYDSGDTFQQDMTTEMHLGDRGGSPWSPPGPPPGPPPGRGGPPPGTGGPPPGGPGMAGPPPGGPPAGSGPASMGGPPGGAPPPMGGPMGGPPPGAGGPPPAGIPAGDLQRVDELRRGFQPRRFGSGYDRGQVDQLFDEVLAGMSGRAAVPVNESQLDPRRFDLVPGGYYEADVDNALREVWEILRRH